MKINKITNAQEFFKVVDDCKGRVELLTGEGDRLNMKSKLCQFMSMTQLFSRADELHLEIVASEEEDLQKICKYLMKYEDMWFRFLFITMHSKEAASGRFCRFCFPCV